MYLDSDTLQCDTALTGRWLRSGDCNYRDQLMMPEQDWLDDLSQWLRHHLSELDAEISQWTATEVTLAVVGLCVAVIVLFWLWRNRFRWVTPERGVRPVDYTLEEDSIYGVDFDAAISDTLRQADFAGAVRWIYLRYLRRLSDSGIIVWEPGRTPDDYVKAMPPGAERDTLRRLTAQYVRVRYGHYPATRELAEAMLRAGDAEKGGEA